jgi:hypothetical protein
MFGGSNSCVTLRAAAIPTTSYVLSTAVTTLMANQIVFNVDVTIGTATAVKVKALFSNSGNVSNSLEWFTEPITDTSTVSGSEVQQNVYERVYTMTTSGRLAIPVGVKAKWACMAVQGAGTLTSTTVSVMANVGVV